MNLFGRRSVQQREFGNNLDAICVGFYPAGIQRHRILKMIKTLSLSALFFLAMGLMIAAYASVPV